MEQKIRQFFFGWKDYPLQPDRFQTNASAARLLIAWRRASTQGRKVFSLERLGVHHYRVTHNDSGEVGVIRWE